MTEPTFNPPRNCRRVLPEIFINHLKDQATETSDLFKKHGEEAERDLQRASTSNEAEERQRNIDAYNRKRANHRKQVNEKLDQQTAQGNEDMKRMNPTQQREYVEISGSVEDYTLGSLTWVSERVKEVIAAIIRRVVDVIRKVVVVFSAVGRGFRAAWNWLRGC